MSKQKQYYTIDAKTAYYGARVADTSLTDRQRAYAANKLAQLTGAQPQPKSKSKSKQSALPAKSVEQWRPKRDGVYTFGEKMQHYGAKVNDLPPSNQRSYARGWVQGVVDLAHAEQSVRQQYIGKGDHR